MRLDAAVTLRKRLVPDSLAELRRDLAVAYRIVANEGILDAFRHISLCNPKNPQRYFLSRSRAPGLECGLPPSCAIDHAVRDFRRATGAGVPPRRVDGGERAVLGQPRRVR